MAVNDLGDLVKEFVFLGGCATGLLIVDAAAPPIRETVDVDVIVQVLSKAEYYALSDRLRDAGFKEDTRDGAPICRWTNARVLLDVMPTDPAILGFGNAWYATAMAHALDVELPSGQTIRLVAAPYFLITKLEAFAGRGVGDYQPCWMADLRSWKRSSNRRRRYANHWRSVFGNCSRSIASRIPYRDIYRRTQSARHGLPLFWIG